MQRECNLDRICIYEYCRLGALSTIIVIVAVIIHLWWRVSATNDKHETCEDIRQWSLIWNARSAHVPPGEWNALPSFSRLFHFLPRFLSLFIIMSHLIGCRRVDASVRFCAAAQVTYMNHSIIIIVKSTQPTTSRVIVTWLESALLHSLHSFHYIDATTTPSPIFVRFRFWILHEVYSVHYGVTSFCAILLSERMHKMYFRFIRFAPIWHWVWANISRCVSHERDICAAFVFASISLFQKKKNTLSSELGWVLRPYWHESKSRNLPQLLCVIVVLASYCR